MLVKKVIINQFSQSSMTRILIILEDEQQVSFWIGEEVEHIDVVESLLSSANDLVRKAERIHQTISTSK